MDIELFEGTEEQVAPIRARMEEGRDASQAQAEAAAQQRAEAELKSPAAAANVNRSSRTDKNALWIICFISIAVVVSCSRGPAATLTRPTRPLRQVLPTNPSLPTIPTCPSSFPFTSIPELANNAFPKLADNPFVQHTYLSVRQEWGLANALGDTPPDTLSQVMGLGPQELQHKLAETETLQATAAAAKALDILGLLPASSPSQHSYSAPKPRKQPQQQQKAAGNGLAWESYAFTVSHRGAEYQQVVTARIGALAQHTRQQAQALMQAAAQAGMHTAALAESLESAFNTIAAAVQWQEVELGRQPQAAAPVVYGPAPFVPAMCAANATQAAEAAAPVAASMACPVPSFQQLLTCTSTVETHQAAPCAQRDACPRHATTQEALWRALGAGILPNIRVTREDVTRAAKAAAAQVAAQAVQQVKIIKQAVYATHTGMLKVGPIALKAVQLSMATALTFAPMGPRPAPVAN